MKDLERLVSLKQNTLRIRVNIDPVPGVFFLFDSILYVLSTIFSYKGTGLTGLNQYLAMSKVFAQGHYTVTPVRLETAAPRSRVKHSTTEPLRSLCHERI